MSSHRVDGPVEQFGPYEVYEQLGIGGMATVHRAKKQGIEGFQRVVALKRLLSHLADDESFIKSFVREARLASYLQHTNIIQIYDLGRVERVYFIAMEFVHGRDLRQVLKQTAYASGPMPVPVMLSLTRQLCDALEYAHTRKDDDGEPLGIVHRDISPSNLLLSSDGNIKIIDFGIAKATSSSLRTQTGRVKGKFAYMAPEAIRGKPLDHRSDIFAAGIVAHEMLTARPLFATRSEYDTLRKITKLPIEPPSRYNPDCPPDLDDIVMTALARTPEERWQSAGAMQRALEHVARKLALQATNREIAEWVTWAFEQPLQAERVEHRALRERVGEASEPAMTAPAGPRMSTLDRASIEVVWGNRSDDDEDMDGDTRESETMDLGEVEDEGKTQETPAGLLATLAGDSGRNQPAGLVRSWASATARGVQQAVASDAAAQARVSTKGSTLYGVAPPPQTPRGMAAVTPRQRATEAVAQAAADGAPIERTPADGAPVEGTPADRAPIAKMPSRSDATELARPRTARRLSRSPALWLGILILLSAGGAAAGYFLVPSDLFGDDAPLTAPAAPQGNEPVASARAAIQPSSTEPRSIDAAAARRIAGEILRAPAQGMDTPYVVRARLCIDERGQVSSVEVTDVPEALAAETRRVLSTWRYEPVMDSGAAVPACFAIETVPRD